MDVNGTQFHLLLGKDDWLGDNDSLEPDLAWDEAHASLTLNPLLFQFPRPPGDQLLYPEHRRGAGMDRYENWYYIDEGKIEIRSLAKDTRISEHYWSAEDLAKSCQQEGSIFRPVRAPSKLDMKLSGLAVTENHYLVVGVIEPAGILIFDLYAGGPPIQMLWPAQVPFKPFDIAPAPDGGVWILDRDNARYWKLDCNFQVVAIDQEKEPIESPDNNDFQPETGVPRRKSRRYFPIGISLQMASPVEARQPLSIEALPDGTILILDADQDITIYRYRFGRSLGSTSLKKEIEKILDIQSIAARLGTFTFLGHDIAFLPDNDTEGILYLVATDGNQVFAFDLKYNDMDFSIDLLKRYFPLRLFSGKGLIAAGQAVYYDLQDRWLPVVEQSRPRYKEKGMLETPVFDGKEINCIWHRLFLDAYIPPGTEVLVESRAANEKNILDQMQWQEEPHLYLRDGSELPYYQAYSTDEAKLDGIGTWELLFQNARGRYLGVRLTLIGTGRSTPWIRALRVYYPRFSYLKEYLPAVYRDNINSASFLERFLANMEGIYTVLEGRIEQVQMLFDIRTTEYLDWLGGWLGIILDPAWDEARKRLFLSHAVQLFKERGTVTGLIHAIRLSTDPCPDETLFDNEPSSSYSVRIIEQYLTRSVPGVVYGDPSQVEGPGVTTDISTWTPAQGAEFLHNQYRKYLQNRYHSIQDLNKVWGEQHQTFDEILLSPLLPDKLSIAEDWIRFMRLWLGFTYAVVGQKDEPAYREFLLRRYQQISLLNSAYQLNLTSFNEIKLPKDLPTGGKQLYDWIHFVSLMLPITQNAHRFTVLVPTDLQADIAAQEQQLNLVRRIVELEKPAHTDFQVKRYWALFRAGEARLGLDTLLGRGSRYAALVLGKSSLQDSFLSPSHPWDVSDRIVLGRDKIGSQQ